MVIAILRFISVVNAAIWLGSAIFFTFAAGPAFFTPEMKALIPPPYNGLAAQLILKRYFYLQHVCGGVALLHLVAEWIYFARPMERLVSGTLIGVICLGLIGGLWIQPKLKHLNYVKFSARATAVEREDAGSSFAVWHGISMVFNLMMVGGVAFYFWSVMRTPSQTRFNSTTRYRS